MTQVFQFAKFIEFPAKDLWSKARADGSKSLTNSSLKLPETMVLRT